jgi:aryl-alcohol dehydrogenase-like predicted oxidoreductase
LYAKTGFDEIDTAILYQQGKTEKLLGQMVLCFNPINQILIFQGVGKKFKIAAKVNSHYPKQAPSAGLGKESLRKQFETSLKNLKMTSV